MSDSTATLRGPAPGLAERVPVTRRFFLGMAVLMLMITVVGFARTYFLKGLFDTPVLPPYLHVHDVLFTSWFVLFLVQTSLVARRDIRLHRRLGVAGGALAGATFRISEHQVVNDAVYGLGGLTLLLAVVMVHDVRVRGRPHPVVLWGAPLLLGSIMLTGLALPHVGFTQTLILMLG